MIPGPRKRSRRPVAGDVVVTTVARHYHVGRVQMIGTVLSAIAVMNRREDALQQASDAATGHPRVFIYGNAGSRDCVEIAGATPR